MVGAVRTGWRHERAAVLGTALLLAGCGAGHKSATGTGPAATTSPTTSAAAGSPSATTRRCSGRPTIAETEGPYFKAGSPARTSLLQTGMRGTRLVLTGQVLTTSCRPVSGALLDFWQADASGAYDNSDHRLRGHQLTDANGRYALTTIVPGEYPGRTQHIHVKVKAPGKPELTTQLYLPGAPGNQRDAIFDPSLLMRVRDTGSGKAASFDFILM
jgi:protocatechuate 3,4-dioxygenase beta subunit